MKTKPTQEEQEAAEVAAIQRRIHARRQRETRAENREELLRENARLRARIAELEALTAEAQGWAIANRDCLGVLLEALKVARGGRF